MSERPDGEEQRRPTADDLGPILEAIWNGDSLRAACRKLGLHVPSTSDWLHDDPGRSEQYARARDGRTEFYQEQALEMGHAAATGGSVMIDGEAVKIDPVGLRVHLDGIKWATARMSPKSAPITRVEHLGEIGTRTDDEIAARIAALEAQARGEG